jgi:hypothetical protein
MTTIMPGTKAARKTSIAALLSGIRGRVTEAAAIYATDTVTSPGAMR